MANHGVISHPRVILHLDMDAFYAQVEYARHPEIPRTRPLAVQQWNGLIAVSYPARDKGVSRFMSIAEAKKRAPDIALIHVDVVHDKVSLEAYREASRTIIDCLEDYCGSKSIIEKASVDEVYMDCTDEVARRVNSTVGWGSSHISHNCDEVESEGEEESFLDPDKTQHDTDYMLHIPAHSTTAKPFSAMQFETEHDAISAAINQTHIVGHDASTPWYPLGPEDRALFVGAQFAAELRVLVERRTSYTFSAGISHNKLFAKIGSAKNKPAAQTILPAALARSMLLTMPVKKVPGLGGKLGDKLSIALGKYTEKSGRSFKPEESGETPAYVSDVLNMSNDQLREAVGPASAVWLQQYLRGNDTREVARKGPPKSILEARAMSKPVVVSSKQQMKEWIESLSAGLATRIIADSKRHHRWPSSVTVRWRYHKVKKEISRSSGIPGKTASDKTLQNTITESTISVLNQNTSGDARLSGLSICALYSGSTPRVSVGDLSSMQGALQNFLHSKGADGKKKSTPSSPVDSDVLEGAVSKASPIASTKTAKVGKGIGSWITSTKINQSPAVAEPKSQKPSQLKIATKITTKKYYAYHHEDIDQATLSQLPKEIQAEILASIDQEIPRNEVATSHALAAGENLKKEQRPGKSASEWNDLPRMNEVDKGVLDELPPLLRREVLSNIESERKRNRQFKDESTKSNSKSKRLKTGIDKFLSFQ